SHDNHPVPVPCRAVLGVEGYVRDVLRWSALNIYLLELTACAENHPTAIEGPGRGGRIRCYFRSGQWTQIHPTERAYPVAEDVVFADRREDHPSPVGRH